MKRIFAAISLISIVIFLFSCNEEGKNNDSTNNDSTVEKTDTLADKPVDRKVSEETMAKMKKYFTEEQLSKLSEFKKQFDDIKSSKDVANYYKTHGEAGVIVDEMLTKHVDYDNYDLTQWTFLNEYLPGLAVIEGAEGSGPVAQYSVFPLYEKSKQTTENDDNLFFEAIYDTEKKWNDENNVIHIWQPEVFSCLDFETCCSVLGSGLIFKTFKKINEAEVENSNFLNDLKSYKLTLISDIKNNCYVEKKEKVLKELDQIINEIKFGEDMTEKFDLLKAHINSSTADKFDVYNQNNSSIN